MNEVAPPASLGFGISATFSMSAGERRDGFAIVRDIITKHRQKWAAQHLDRYLRQLWETELRETARHFNVLLEEKGKPPTLKQFAKYALGPTNHWFRGDVRALYAAIGQKAPAVDEPMLILPGDRVGFAWTVFAALGGRPFTKQIVVGSREEGTRQAEEQQRHHQLKRLAEKSLIFVQLEEALGRPPTVEEFGRAKFEPYASALDADLSNAWQRYERAIQEATCGPRCGCVSDANCAAGRVCQGSVDCGGTCVPRCTNESCLSGICRANGLCCATACVGIATEICAQPTRCDYEGACAYSVKGTDCGTTCAGDWVRANTCNGAGGCIAGAPMVCDGGLACGATDCNPFCTSDGGCAIGYFCGGFDSIGHGTCSQQI